MLLLLSNDDADFNSGTQEFFSVQIVSVISQVILLVLKLQYSLADLYSVFHAAAALSELGSILWLIFHYLLVIKPANQISIDKRQGHRQKQFRTSRMEFTAAFCSNVRTATELHNLHQTAARQLHTAQETEALPASRSTASKSHNTAHQASTVLSTTPSKSRQQGTLASMHQIKDRQESDCIQYKPGLVLSLRQAIHNTTSSAINPTAANQLSNQHKLWATAAYPLHPAITKPNIASEQPKSQLNPQKQQSPAEFSKRWSSRCSRTASIINAPANIKKKKVILTS
ncbi:hypothetical protein Nepgr_016358 [Nepenthes gracilis]|uniref:Uncharacterized protein n=1 Tax=Nepenthes gracilis TaxID=150966 RepID=A0AAD3XR87_NEPGR|nr:hypothetical protein Nepgr_016358 [Nepenthes gracilis]